MKLTTLFVIGCTIAATAVLAAAAPARPNLVLTAHDASLIRARLGSAPVFDAQYTELKSFVDKALALPIDVPVPVDAGGYTHGRHKQNYKEMYGAGVLYSITRDARYASFVRDMLMKYAALYPTLGNHPAGTGPAPGRLFWQTLNEAVWLLNAAQAYDCIYDWIPDAERRVIETRLLRPMATFFYVDHVKEFDRIHNHGTWTAAAVAMLGYALHDQSMVDLALYGTKHNGSGGFFRQLDLLFSPDGYYMEGPYYMRYALEPFFVLAQAIDNNQPELRIFGYRDSLLKKALYCCVQMTSASGNFFPMNDAMKEKSYLSPEIIIALDITFRQYGGDRALLGIAKRQNSVTVSGAGLAVAQALSAATVSDAFPYASAEFRDGPRGEQGGIGTLRAGTGEDQEILVMKYAGHGKEHGHFDALTFLWYDQNREIIQDYGSARFLNVEQKSGGRYLPENRSFTKQTIAHNTVTVDERSQHNGDETAADAHSARRHFFSANDPSFQIMSATDSGSSPGVALQRTMAIVTDGRLVKPVVIDIVRIVSADAHQYDLPFYYMGHMIGTNVRYTAHAQEQRPMGTQYGYQHLWNEAEGTSRGTMRVSWINGERYYSLHSAADTVLSVYYTRIGANDPDFNLRHDAGVMLRARASNATFASVLEPHGRWDGTLEISEGAMPTIIGVRVAASNDEGTVIDITGKDKLHWVLMVTNRPASASASHTIRTNGVEYTWTGNAALTK